MTKELAEQELQEIYIGIGSGELNVDDFIERINELEDIVDPYTYTPPPIYCVCEECWECAARRGGCMEDV
jgi:hypothetical protein